LEVEIIEKIKIAKNKDEEIVRIVEEMKKAGVKVLREEKLQMKKKIILNRKIDTRVYSFASEDLNINGDLV